MDFSNSNDDVLLCFYDSVRQQVDLDNRAGGRYRFAGESVKEYAERIREEMDRRRLNFKPIEWPR
jgi:site-specific DNA-adenine methylase